MIRFRSTRGEPSTVPLSAALYRGIAPDGGLYVPESWPRRSPEDFRGRQTLAEIGETLLQPFFEGDVLEPALPAIAADAFSIPAPLVPIAGLDAGERASMLELYWGPTAAFKDFGARFLAAALERLAGAKRTRPLTILVATSGDTGGAVAAAFHRRPFAQVVVLYPRGLVSPRQEQQLTCWGDNVRALSVRGSFDDCQRLVKEAFADPRLRAALDFSSANSINVGRLLPQAVYYAQASLQIFAAHGAKASFVIPAGNLGNSLACVWAKEMGLPIDAIVLAHNQNRGVPDLLATGRFEPRPSVATLASAMDVGNPSNLERLLALYPEIEQLRAKVSALSVDDAAIRERIRAEHAATGLILCPHTATAAEAYRRLPPDQRRRGPWVWVATAHPAKFPETVEPLIGRPVAIPESLARLLELPAQKTEIEASLSALAAQLCP